jgi:hypothetical protein
MEEGSIYSRKLGGFRVRKKIAKLNNFWWRRRKADGKAKCVCRERRKERERCLESSALVLASGNNKIVG